MLFDIHVIDTDAQSYLSHASDSVLFKADVEKKQKYSAAAHHACSLYPTFFSR